MASTTRNKQGHLRVGVTDRQGGRKIDTWTFHPGDAAGVLDRKEAIEFEVSMLNTLQFVVDTKGIPGERWTPLQGGVLSDLHAQALAAARAEFDLAHGLAWSDWLEITIKESSSYDRSDAIGSGQAHLSYTKIARAETTDGRAFTVNGNGIIVEFPEPVGVGKLVDGKRRTRRDRVREEQIKTQNPEGPNGSVRLSTLLNATDQRDADTQFAYLPDTPENRAGLDAIVRAIDGINVRLQEFLKPENIQATLERASVDAGRLLAGPEAASSSPSSRKPGP